MLTTQRSYDGTSYRARGDLSGTIYNTTTNGTAIAYGMTIENARGSLSSDTILGNRTNNNLQEDDYARITDFDWRDDYIQAQGTSYQYSLQTGNWFGSSVDTAIFFGNDAIGVVQDSTNVNFSRDFIFV